MHRVGYYVDPRLTGCFNNYRNHVNPPLGIGDVSLGKIVHAQGDQFAGFLCRYRILWIAVGAGGSGFDFDDNYLVSVSGDDVDLANSASIISLNYLISALQEFGLGHGLPVCTKVVAAEARI